MSVVHKDRLNLIAQSLRDHLALLPTPASDRIVTRSWKPLQNHNADEMKAGVYTLIWRSEGDFPNYNGGEAQDGLMQLLLIGRVQLPEKSTGEDIEDMEASMFDDEVAPWLRALPQELCCLVVKNFVASGQLSHPYASVVFELEECTS